MRAPVSLSLLSFVILFASVAPAHALEPIEVRQPEGGGEYRPSFGPAFGPCLAPNTTTNTGEPACTPAVRSACGLPIWPIELAISGRQEFQPKLRLLYDTTLANLTPECANGDYAIEIRTRDRERKGVGGLSGNLACVEQFVVAQLSARDRPWHERLRRAALREECARLERVVPRRVVHVLAAAGRCRAPR